MRKGEITLKILELITRTAEASFDIIDAILNSGYGASYQKMNRKLNQNEIQRSKEEAKRQRFQNYYNTLYRLKKDNLISEKEESGKKVIKITQQGIKKLTFLKKEFLAKKNLPDKHYHKENRPNFTIVVFDIPEKNRRLSGWLREVLKNLDFRMIQKSVWIGKTKIPKEFLNDIFKLKLENFVEIFEISKTGSLKQLT